MSNWNDLLAQANLDKDALKAGLPLEYVMEESGVELELRNGKLVAHCPWHDDEDPSFELWGDDLDRWGCWPCGLNGDLYAFLMQYHNVDFKKAVELAFDLWRDFQKVNWEPTRVERREPREPVDFAVECRMAWEDARDTRLAVLRNFLFAKGQDAPRVATLPPKWLHEEFFLGTTTDQAVIIPHLNEDKEITGFKYRYGTGHPYATEGSVLSSQLYGVWRDTGKNDVILCEGESDTWVVAWEFRDTHDAFGLPAGAGMHPKDAWLTKLRDRTVTLLFDGDSAGRNAAARWHDRLIGVASDVFIAPMEDGADAATAADLRAVVRDAMAVPTDVSGILEDQQTRCYVKMRQNTPVPITDWIIEPTRYLTGEDTHAVEGLIRGKPIVLTNEHISSKKRLEKWSNEEGFSWRGSDQDVQGLYNFLMRAAPFLPYGKLTRTAGWHEGHMVLPNGQCIGPRYWRYVPPAADPQLERHIEVMPGNWNRNVIPTMLNLHERDVVTPILAWLAAAPLRTQVKFFPTLGVMGGSGYGKSTLVREILRIFWGWKLDVTLANTTNWSVYAYAMASNGVPIWFDEYRPGSRQDAMNAVNQVIRAAYDGSAVVKGGMDSANLQKLTHMNIHAPIIISGEDAFTEVSHIERMALVNLPREGKSKKHLQQLRDMKAEGFGHAYLTWLCKKHFDDELVVAPEPALDRLETVYRVLTWGWELLSEFSAEVVGIDIGELELTRIQHEAEDVAPPILEAIAWAVGKHDKRDAGPVVWFEEGDVLVRTRELTHLVKQDGTFTMPGGERAIMKWLEQQFQATREKTTWGLALRLPSAKASLEAIGLVESDD